MAEGLGSALGRKIRLAACGLRRPPPAGPPILVTGIPRSGTTWVGRMLALSPEVGYVHEPFNPDVNAGLRCPRLEARFQYVCAENAGDFHASAARPIGFGADLIAGLRDAAGLRGRLAFLGDWMDRRLYRWARRRPLVKDPLALHAAPWLAETFGMQVVVVVRHPAALLASVQALGWTPRFTPFLEQPLLMRGPLAPLAAEIRAFAERDDPALLDRAILFYKCAMHVILTHRDAHPDWIFVRHEDLASDPIAGFGALCGQLGLDVPAGMPRAITAHTEARNPIDSARGEHALRLDSRAVAEKWKARLAPGEIARLRDELEAWWRPFYDDADWPSAPASA